MLKLVNIFIEPVLASGIYIAHKIMNLEEGFTNGHTLRYFVFMCGEQKTKRCVTNGRD